MHDNKLDRIDIRILAALQENGRLKNVDLAEQVSLSPSPCLQRVKRLEQLGYIVRYRAEIDLAKIGETVRIFTEITIAEHTLEDHRYFNQQIAKVPQVVECYQVSGGYDYLVHFICRSIQEYQDVVQEILDSDMKVNKYFSYVVLKSIVPHRPAAIEALSRIDA